MPVYSFECRKCHSQYDDLAPYDETGKYPKVACPQCKSKRKDKVMSRCSMTFVNGEGTKWWAASHDRRFFHKLEKDRKLREEAEQKSHMGSDPYPHIDDVGTGKFFGEVR